MNGMMCVWHELVDFMLGVRYLSWCFYHQVATIPLSITHKDSPINQVMCDINSVKRFCILNNVNTLTLNTKPFLIGNNKLSFLKGNFFLLFSNNLQNLLKVMTLEKGLMNCRTR